MNSTQINPLRPFEELPKCAWVTGAGKGIGRTLVRRLLKDGWTVYASARTDSDLSSLREEAKGLPGEAVPLALDVTDRDACQRALETINDGGEPLGLVVLNAGTHTPTPASNFDLETVDRIMTVNVTGTLNCLAPAMSVLREQGYGKIAVVASVAGYKGLPKAAAYCASKSALIAMCESLRPELSTEGVEICVINPGFVRTPLTDKNDFPMPFLMEPDAATSAIIAGLRGRSFEIAFPTRFVLILKFIRLLPDWLYFKITERMVNDG